MLFKEFQTRRPWGCVSEPEEQKWCRSKVFLDGFGQFLLGKRLCFACVVSFSRGRWGWRESSNSPSLLLKKITSMVGCELFVLSALSNGPYIFMVDSPMFLVAHSSNPCVVYLFFLGVKEKPLPKGAAAVQDYAFDQKGYVAGAMFLGVKLFRVNDFWFPPRALQRWLICFWLGFWRSASLATHLLFVKKSYQKPLNTATKANENREEDFKNMKEEKQHEKQKNSILILGTLLEIFAWLFKLCFKRKR